MSLFPLPARLSADDSLQKEGYSCSKSTVYRSPPPSTPGVGTALPLADAGKRDPRPAFIELPTYRTYYELRPKIPHPNRPKPAVKVYAGLSPSSVSG